MTNNILTNHTTLHSHDPHSLMLKSSSQPQLMMNDEPATVPSATPRSTPTSMVHAARMSISKQHHGLDQMMVTTLNSSNGDGNTSGNNGQLVQTSGNEVRNVMLYGIPIVSLLMDGQERLCLAQISNTLLKTFSYNEIHNRRVALGITCVQCTPVQLELLRRAGAMPVSSRRCGMITKREAERLCKSFLAETEPPKLPESFSFDVYHSCAWGCRGSFTPSRYNSSRAKCIKCSYCGLFFSPNKFIFHSHRLPSSKYVQPDAANFNSWRRHIKLVGNPEPADHVIFAWEDVKAMFNGGSRKRAMTSTLNSFTKNQEHHHQQHHQQQSTNNHHINHHRGRSSSGVVVGGGKSDCGSASQRNSNKHLKTNNSHNSTPFVSDMIDSNNSDDDDLIDDIVGQDSSLDFDVRSGSDGNSIDKSRTQQNTSENGGAVTTTPYRFSSLLTADSEGSICRPDTVHDHGEHHQHHLHHHQVQIIEGGNLQGHCLRTEKSFETLPLPQSARTIHDSNTASIETINIHQNNDGDNISAAAVSVSNTCLSSPSISSPSLSSSVAASSPRSPVPSRPHPKSNPSSSLNQIKEIANEYNNTHSAGKDLASKSNPQSSIQKMANFPRTPANVPFSINACLSPQQQHPLAVSTIRQINDLNYVHHHLGTFGNNHTSSSTSSSSSSSSPLTSSLTSAPKFSLGGRLAHHPTSASATLGGLINSNTAHPAILSSLLATNHQPMVSEHGSPTANSNDNFTGRSVSFRTSNFIPVPSTSSTVTTTNTNQHHHHNFDRQTSTMSYSPLLPPPPPPFPPSSASTTVASAAAVSNLMMAAHQTDFPHNLAEFMWNMASRAAAAAVTSDLPEAETPTSNPYANFIWPTLPPPPPPPAIPPPPQSLGLSPPAHIADPTDNGIRMENTNNSAEMELRKALLLHHQQQQQPPLSRASFPPPPPPYLSPFLPNFLAPNMRFLSHVGSSLNQDKGPGTIPDGASKSQSSPLLSNIVEEQSTSSQVMFPFRPATTTTTAQSQSSISTATQEGNGSSIGSSFEIIAARNQFLFDTYHKHMNNLTAVPTNTNTASTIARSTVLNPFLGPSSFSDSGTSTVLKSNLLDPRFSLEHNQLPANTINETLPSQSPSLMTFGRKNGYFVNNNHYHGPKQSMMLASGVKEVPKLAASNGMKKRSFNNNATSNGKAKKIKQRTATNQKPIRRSEFSVEQHWDQRTIRKTTKPDDGLIDLSRPISNHIRFSNDRQEIGSKMAAESRQQTKQQSFDLVNDNMADKQLFLEFKNSEQEDYDLVDVDQDHDHNDATSESPTIKDASMMLVVDDDDDDQDGDATIEDQSKK